MPPRLTPSPSSRPSSPASSPLTVATPLRLATFAAAAATLTCVATATAHVIVAHLNRAAVSRRAAYASPRASNLTSVTLVVVTNRLATRTTHVCVPARLAGAVAAVAGRLTSSLAPRRRVGTGQSFDWKAPKFVS